MDNAIGLSNTFPLEIDLFGEEHYPTFQQLGPGDNVMVSGPIKYWAKISISNLLVKVFKQFLVGFAIFV